MKTLLELELNVLGNPILTFRIISVRDECTRVGQKARGPK